MDVSTTDPALAELACVDCGIGSAELTAFSRHISHLSADLPADQQRSLRAHLFALLAGAGASPITIDVRNEYPLLNTPGEQNGSMSA
jgi:hypothetical protein